MLNFFKLTCVFNEFCHLETLLPLRRLFRRRSANVVICDCSSDYNCELDRARAFVISATATIHPPTLFALIVAGSVRKVFLCIRGSVRKVFLCIRAPAPSASRPTQAVRGDSEEGRHKRWILKDRPTGSSAIVIDERQLETAAFGIA